MTTPLGYVTDIISSPALDVLSDCATVAVDMVDSVISDLTKAIFLWLISAVICQLIAIFGIGSNIVNIICFIKQGFKDTVNVSLFGLAVSDLCSLAPLIWANICLTPAVTGADLPFDPREFQYLTGAMPHATFTRITALITAVITAERCLCVAAPLKVKIIVTPRRMLVFIVCVFIVYMASVSPVYAVNLLRRKFFPHRNTTAIGLVYTRDQETVEKISFAVNNTFLPFTSFMIIIVCTITLALQLHQKNKWRKNSTTSQQADTLSYRNQKVAKMVVMISALFIVCFIPLSCVFLAMSVVPGLSIGGKYKNTLAVVGGLCFTLECVNSSLNIFIYYHMSSKYRDVFRLLFKMKCLPG